MADRPQPLPSLGLHQRLAFQLARRRWISLQPLHSKKGPWNGWMMPLESMNFQNILEHMMLNIFLKMFKAWKRHKCILCLEPAARLEACWIRLPCSCMEFPSHWLSTTRHVAGGGKTKRFDKVSPINYDILTYIHNIYINFVNINMYVCIYIMCFSL